MEMLLGASLSGEEARLELADGTAPDASFTGGDYPIFRR